MSSIFISYRREDSQDFTLRLAENLNDHFGPNSVFVDVENIAAGEKFSDRIERAVNECRVLLVVIGKSWLTAQDEAGNLRLHKESDYVRREIELALQRQTPIIPVLYNARMPKAEELPDSIKELTLHNAIEIPNTWLFGSACGGLREVLANRFGVKPRHAPAVESILIGISATMAFFLGCGTFVAPVDFSSGFRVADPADALSLAIGWIALIAPLFGICLSLTVYGVWRCCGRLAREKRVMFPGAIGLSTREKSGKAVMSLALGLASFGWSLVASVPAIVVGAMSLRQISRHPDWFRGRAIAIQGIVFALLGTSVWCTQWYVIWNGYRSVSSFQQGHEAWKEGQLDNAKRFADVALRRLPNNAHALKLRGIVSYQQEQYTSAIADLNEAIGIFPEVEPWRFDLAETYYYRALAHRESGDEVAFQRDLRRARDLAPGQFSDPSPTAPAPPVVDPSA